MKTIDISNEIDKYTDATTGRIAAEKALFLRHTPLNDCTCGGRAHLVSFCDNRSENGTIWTYDIFCTNPDCKAYLTLSKMVEKGKSSFEVEEKARKSWNKPDEEWEEEE